VLAKDKRRLRDEDDADEREERRVRLLARVGLLEEEEGEDRDQAGGEERERRRVGEVEVLKAVIARDEAEKPDEAAQGEEQADPGRACIKKKRKKCAERGDSEAAGQSGAVGWRCRGARAGKQGPTEEGVGVAAELEHQVAANDCSPNGTRQR